jgi:WhiB family transcriptional regulator, redox-sensing transcriptional regulator
VATLGRVDEDQAANVDALAALAAAMGDAPSWQADAACLDVDPGVFFPERGATAAEALGHCGRCEVAARCLEFALAIEAEEGVYGGTTAADRRQLVRARRRRQQRTADRPTCPEHPDRPVVARGGCTTCYGRWRRRNRAA